jgi:hypothetical protein
VGKKQADEIKSHDHDITCDEGTLTTPNYPNLGANADHTKSTATEGGIETRPLNINDVLHKILTANMRYFVEVV